MHSLSISKGDILAFLTRYHSLVPQQSVFNHYQTYSIGRLDKSHYPVEVKSEKAEGLAIISEDFRTLFSLFSDKQAIFICSFLKKHANSLTKEQFQLDCIDFEDLELEKTFGNPILKLTIDFGQLTEKQLTDLPQKINKLSVIFLCIKGDAPSLFIERLKTVQWFQFENASEQLTQYATQIGYRNQLQQIFSVADNNDEALIRKWAALEPIHHKSKLNVLYYIKGNLQFEKIFSQYLCDLYSKDHKELRNLYSNINDIDKFEFYSLVNACVLGMGDLFFTLFVKQLNYLKNDSKKLVINQIINKGMLRALNENLVAFNDMDIFVNRDTLNDPEFKKLLLSLNKTGIKILRLTLTDDTSVSGELFNFEIQYQIVFQTSLGRTLYEGEFFEREKILQDALLKKFQDANYRKLFPQENSSPPSFAPESKVDDEAQFTSHNFPIRKRTSHHTGSPIIEEIHHHIEEQEEEHKNEEQVIHQHDISQSVEQQELSLLSGHEDLIDFWEFDRRFLRRLQCANLIADRPDLFKIERELFSTTFEGIKFLTRPAAFQIAKYLGVYFVWNDIDLRLEAIDDHFTYNRDHDGHLLVDYDSYLVHPSDSPLKSQYWDFPKQFYNENKADTQKVITCFGTQNQLLSIFSNDIKKFYSILLFYGAKGLTYFIDRLSNSTPAHPEFIPFICSYYLLMFDEYHCLLQDNDFFDGLKLVNSLSKVQVDCLKKFLIETGSSRYNLKTTVQAFQKLWDAWEKLAKKNQILLTAINSDWKTLNRGHPQVYMQRLYAILEHTDNLPLQLSHLDGLLLTKEIYHLMTSGKINFITKKMLSDQGVIESGWEDIFENLSVGTEYKNLYSFLAYQKYARLINLFEEVIKTKPYINLSTSLISLLLTNLHSSAQHTDSFIPLFKAALQLQTDNLTLHKELNTYLFKLYNLEKYFTNYDALLIITAINNFPKIFQNLKYALETHPIITLKCLEKLNKFNLEPRFDLLAPLQEDPELVQNYSEDLLLFCSLFTFEEGFQIKEFLSDLAKLSRPNKQYTLFRKILSSEPCPFNTIQALFDKTKKEEPVTYDGISFTKHDSKYLVNASDGDSLLAKQSLLKTLAPSEEEEKYSEETLTKVWEKTAQSLDAASKQRLLNPLKRALLDSSFADPIFETLNKEEIMGLEKLEACDELSQLEEARQEVLLIANFLKHVKIKTNLWPSISWNELTSGTISLFIPVLTNFLELSNSIELIEKLAVLQKTKAVQAFQNDLKVLQRLKQLNTPKTWLVTTLHWIENGFDATSLPESIRMILEDSSDILKDYLMTSKTPDLLVLFPLLPYITEEQDKISIIKLIEFLSQSNQLTSFLNKLMEVGISYEKNAILLQIMSKVRDGSTGNDYVELLDLIKKFSFDEGQVLLEVCKLSAPNIKSCLTSQYTTFKEFLYFIECHPFHLRDERVLKKQFDTSQVQRVINRSKDLMNNTIYSYEYRKQWMETFFLVNDCGYKLPVYNGKPAYQLSHSQIRDLFLKIKSRQDMFSNWSTLNCQLYALPLMREAMYRTTKMFPNSTQILSLIDALFHRKNIITQLKPGEGKSLIDVMKASLLWICSEKRVAVDLVTDSLKNILRDINIFSPYFTLLDIPHQTQPLTSNSSECLTNGINFSTANEIRHFRLKQFLNLKKWVPDIACLVGNEFDFMSLYDLPISRRGMGNSLVSERNEWIYKAIYNFIHCDAYNDPKNAGCEVVFLKKFLKKVAPKTAAEKFIDDLSETQCLTWIDSAVTVSELKKGSDYLITKDSCTKRIHGRMQCTRSIQILSKIEDGTGDPIIGSPHPTISYGGGVQQLLFASLNENLAEGDIPFVLESETPLKLSLCYSDFLLYYIKNNGIIWGSTATAGSEEERLELSTKFNLDFSGIESHYDNSVDIIEHKPAPNKNSQFETIFKEIEHDSGRAHLVYFKNEGLALKFQAYIISKNAVRTTQTYFGTEDLESVIEQAAKPGCVTIATSVITRNIDIKSSVLTVYLTFWEDFSSRVQKMGRTGRQAAKGKVHIILNEEDLARTSKKQIEETIYQNLKAKRDKQDLLFNPLAVFNDSLMDTIDNELNEVPLVDPKTFISDIWTEWCQNYATYFEQQFQLANFKKETFYTSQINAFLRLLDNHFTVPEQINLENILKKLPKLSPISPVYPVHQQEVTAKDCIAASVIANQFLPKILTEEALSPEEQSKIKTNLASIFKAAEKGRHQDLEKTYLRYLYENPKKLAAIRHLHVQFIDNFIKEKADNLKKNNLIQYFLFHQPSLNQISDNSHYLMLFKGIMGIAPETDNEKNINLLALKSGINTLLDEYLKYSWFVNDSRRASVQHLKTKVDEVGNYQDLLSTLCKVRTEILNKDIKENQDNWYRYFKPLNWTGDSRLQNTINRAFILIDSLAKVNFDDPDIKKWLPNIPDAAITLDSFDGYHNEMQKIPVNTTLILIKKILDNIMHLGLSTKMPSSRVYEVSPPQA